MKLSTQDIQFIDTYLTNSGVFYADIRMEMLDHVASAVEKKMENESIEFYDAFKDYMVMNKKIILKNNREGFSYKDTKTFKESAFFLLKPWSLLSLPLIMAVVYFLMGVVDQDAFHNYYVGFILVVAFIWIIGIYVHRKIYFKGKRFFVIEQSGILFFFIFQIMNPLVINQRSFAEPNFWLYGLFFYFFLNAIAFQIYNLKMHQKKLLKMVS
uniref:hypothetical protein n=1 Tax=Flavobacterium sp. TaxID=239 RepID=UPI00404A33A1